MNADELKDLGPAFRPTARLFLSADLVGSTAHKQAPTFPLRTEGDQWSDLSPPWLSSISDFFSQFGLLIDEHWAKHAAHAKDHGIPVGEPPELWKANGDELIYVKTLRDRRDMYAAVCGWVAAVDAYRGILKKNGKLDIKATAWFAGFPITNSEIVFEKFSLSKTTKYPDDIRLQQIELRERWHGDVKSRETLLLDFIGPTIDTGFRLAGISSARKMVISVDVAFLMASSQLPFRNDSGNLLKWPHVAYDGRVNLKGVLGGKPYPIFWIDMLSRDPLTLSEDKIGVAPKHLSREDVIDFCDHFYEENKSHFLKPFVVDEENSQYGTFPENYKKFLLAVQEKWAAESGRYSTELSEHSGLDGKSLSKQDAKKLADGAVKS